VTESSGCRFLDLTTTTRGAKIDKHLANVPGSQAVKE
jgi:hypothetical protein